MRKSLSIPDTLDFCISSIIFSEDHDSPDQAASFLNEQCIKQAPHLGAITLLGADYAQSGTPNSLRRAATAFLMIAMIASVDPLQKKDVCTYFNAASTFFKAAGYSERAMALIEKGREFKQ